MGLVFQGVPHDLALEVQKVLKLRCFFETGTHIGTTAKWASHHFDSVITVEAAEKFYNTSVENLKGTDNVDVVFGNSSCALAKFINELPNTLFWLDAHWSDGGTAGEDAECPLLAELSIVAPTLYKNVIMIDDARLFSEPPPSPHNYRHWPTLDEIVKTLNSFCQVYTVVKDDVIISVPAVYRSEIVGILRS